jgi:hypothetical protein
MVTEVVKAATQALMQQEGGYLSPGAVFDELLPEEPLMTVT